MSAAVIRALAVLVLVLGGCSSSIASPASSPTPTVEAAPSGTPGPCIDLATLADLLGELEADVGDLAGINPGGSFEEASAVFRPRAAVEAVVRDRPRTHPGLGKMPVCVIGTGATEVDALRDLDDRLRGVPKPDGSRMDELRRRARLACVQGAQEKWPNMTAEELERVIERMP